MKFIYLRTNLINGKQYVGQTHNIEERNRAWKKKSVIYGNQFLSKDRFFYGLENWELKILKEVEDEEADSFEKYFIDKLKTLSPYGYNIQTGGKKGFSYTESEETKIKKSIAKKGKIPKCVIEKKVYQYSLKGEFIKSYKNTREAERITGIPHTNISRCCNGGFFYKKKNKWINVTQAGNFMWSTNPPS